MDLDHLEQMLLEINKQTSMWYSVVCDLTAALSHNGPQIISVILFSSAGFKVNFINTVSFVHLLKNSCF